MTNEHRAAEQREQQRGREEQQRESRDRREDDGRRDGDRALPAREVLVRFALRLERLPRDRSASLADVRLDAGIRNVERVALWELFEEVEIGASLLAQKREVHFSVTSVDQTLVVLADRQILSAAVFNLLQNAFKFTRARSSVWLRASATSTRVLVEVEDECGGLPPGKAEDLLRPFEQGKGGHDRTGLGLGLSICVKAVKAMNGELHVRDLPGKGCIFTIDLPKQPPPPTSIRARVAKGSSSGTTGGKGTGHARTARG